MYLFWWGNHWGNLRDMSKRLLTGTWVSYQGFNKENFSSSSNCWVLGGGEPCQPSPLLSVMQELMAAFDFSLPHLIHPPALVLSLHGVLWALREWQRCPICDWAFSSHSFPAFSWSVLYQCLLSTTKVAGRDSVWQWLSAQVLRSSSSCLPTGASDLLSHRISARLTVPEVRSFHWRGSPF